MGYGQEEFELLNILGLNITETFSAVKEKRIQVIKDGSADDDHNQTRSNAIARADAQPGDAYYLVS